MIKFKHFIFSVALASFLGGCGPMPSADMEKDPVDYVNPYIGNISHLLVPTFPTVQLPNSMLRVYPERSDYTSERVNGLPVVVTNHRERSAFNLTPYQGDDLKPVHAYTYDKEKLTPYSFEVELDDNNMAVKYALSHQSSMGFYQMNPADGVFVFGSPRFDKMSVKVRGGKTFTVEAENNSKENIYIQKVFLNGKPYKKTYITYDDIINGSTLKFVMGKKPNKSFGKAMADRPIVLNKF